MRKRWAYGVCCCWWLNGVVHLLGLGVAACVGGDDDDRVDDFDNGAATLTTLVTAVLAIGLGHLHSIHLLVVHLLASHLLSAHLLAIHVLTAHLLTLLTLLALLALLTLLVLLHVACYT